MALQMKKIHEQLPEDQIQKLREMFDILDDDHSGEMNVEELSNTMRYLGLKMTEQEVENILKEFDDDGSGLIEFEEFMVLIKNMGLRIHNTDIMVIKTLVGFPNTK